MGVLGVSSFTAAGPVNSCDSAAITVDGSGLFSLAACGTASIPGDSGYLSFPTAVLGVSFFTAAGPVNSPDPVVVTAGGSGLFSLAACGTSSIAGESGDISFPTGVLGVSSFAAAGTVNPSDSAVITAGGSGLFSITVCDTASIARDSGDISFPTGIFGVSSFAAAGPVNPSDSAIITADDSELFSLTACGTASVAGDSGDSSFSAGDLGDSSITAAGPANRSDSVILTADASGLFSLASCGTASTAGDSGDLSFPTEVLGVSSFTAAGPVNSCDSAAIAADGSELFSLTACGTASVAGDSGDLSFSAAGVLGVSSSTAAGPVNSSDSVVVTADGSGLFSLAACGTASVAGDSGDLSFPTEVLGVSSFTAAGPVNSCDSAAIAADGSELFSLTACGTASVAGDSGDSSFSAGDLGDSSIAAAGPANRSDSVILTADASGLFSLASCGTASIAGDSGDLSFPTEVLGVSSFTAAGPVNSCDSAAIAADGSELFSLTACGTASVAGDSGDSSFSAGDLGNSSITAAGPVNSCDSAAIAADGSRLFSLTACGTASIAGDSGDLSFPTEVLGVSSFTAAGPVNSCDSAAIAADGSELFSLTACGTASVAGDSGDLSFSTGVLGVSSFAAAGPVNPSDSAVITADGSELFSLTACGTASVAGDSGDSSFSAGDLGDSSITAAGPANRSDSVILTADASGLFSLASCGTASIAGDSGDLSFPTEVLGISSFTAAGPVNSCDSAAIAADGSGLFSLTACGTASVAGDSGDLSFSTGVLGVSSFTEAGPVNSSDSAVITADGSGLFSLTACGTASIAGDSGDISFPTEVLGVSSFAAAGPVNPSESAVITADGSELFSLTACGTASVAGDSGDSSFSAGDLGDSSITAAGPANRSDSVILTADASGLFSLAACGTASIAGDSGDLSFPTEVLADGSGLFSLTASGPVNSCDSAAIAADGSELFSLTACGTASVAGDSGDLSFSAAGVLGVSSSTATGPVNSSDSVVVTADGSGLFSLAACGTASVAGDSGDSSFSAGDLGDSSITAAGPVNSCDSAAIAADGSGLFSLTACGTASIAGDSGDLSFPTEVLGVSSFTAAGPVNSCDSAAIAADGSELFSLTACGTASVAGDSGDLSFSTGVLGVSSFAAAGPVNPSDSAVITADGSELFSLTACGTASIAGDSGDSSFQREI
nr:unnamed protein product [Callosobruchus chinensis]